MSITRKSTYEDYCESIREFSACVDGYPYVVEIESGRCYLSEKILKRFQLEGNEIRCSYGAHEQYIYKNDYEPLMEDLQAVIRGNQENHDCRFRWMGIDNKPIWLHSKGHLVRNEQGEPEFLLGCLNEIGERQHADNVTGLKQTNAIERDLNRGNFPQGFIIRLGLDGFKNVVERLGMEYGDNVLYDVAECIKGCLSDDQRVYRAISDEFLIVDFSGRGEDDALRLYRRIRASIDYYIEAQHYRSVFTISGGMVLTSDVEHQNAEEVMRLSRFALNMAKNRGRNQLYIFDREEYARFIYRRDLHIILRQAVANDFEGFELYYQPIMCSCDGSPYAAESLCRFFWNGKMISPTEFIPILEETGLIIPVGRWIMDQACAMLKECRKYVPDFHLSINLSYVQVLKSGITDELLRYVRKYNLDPNGLIVELTESGYLERTANIEHVWKHLKENGICIAIDDFGTGYSNINYLDRFLPNVIKIDRTFTLGALKKEYAFQLLGNLVTMAHSMDLKVCIEGVETEEELATIREISPDFIQGFYFGKPMNRESFLRENFGVIA